jgi:hypothetical protein
MEFQISQNVVIFNILLNIMNDLMFLKLVAIEWFNGMWSYDCHNWNVQAFSTSSSLCKL